MGDLGEMRQGSTEARGVTGQRQRDPDARRGERGQPPAALRLPGPPGGADHGQDGDSRLRLPTARPPALDGDDAHQLQGDRLVEPEHGPRLRVEPSGGGENQHHRGDRGDEAEPPVDGAAPGLDDAGRRREQTGDRDGAGQPHQPEVGDPLRAGEQEQRERFAVHVTQPAHRGLGPLGPNQPRGSPRPLYGAGSRAAHAGPAATHLREPSVPGSRSARRRATPGGDRLRADPACRPTADHLGRDPLDRAVVPGHSAARTVNANSPRCVCPSSPAVRHLTV